MPSSWLERLVTSPTLLEPSYHIPSPEPFIPTMTKILLSWRVPLMAARTSSSGSLTTWRSATWSGSQSGAVSTTSSLESSSWTLPSTRTWGPWSTCPTFTSSSNACISPLGLLPISNQTDTAQNIQLGCDCSVFLIIANVAPCINFDFMVILQTTAKLK